MKYRLPYNVLRNPNAWENVPRDPVTLYYAAVSLGYTGAYVSGGAFFYASTFLVSIATSWATTMLSPKPDFSSFASSGTLVNTRDAVAPQDFVYGEIRKGGTVTFYETTGASNTYLHQIIALAGHEVQSIGDVYLNDEIVTIDGNNLVTSNGYNGKIRIKKLTGAQTATDSDLLSETSVTSAFIGSGIAYLYVRYEYDQDVFANGLPLVTAKVQGKKVYDPRSASTAYSANAALCVRDFLTSGYGLSDSSIDDVDFATAANECDENITLAAGGTEKRYAINGIVKANTAVGTVLTQMSTACAGTLFWGGGKWKLKAGAFSSAVKTLTLDDLRGPISLKTRNSMNDNFNIVRGTFNDAAQDFITADFPQIKSSTFIAQDNGEEVPTDLALPFTTSASAAQRLAKMTLYRSREQMTFSADFGLEAFNIEAGDNIAFTNPRYGFDAKIFEVQSWKFSANQQAGDLRVTLTLRETSSAAFDWNAEETAIVSNDSTLPTFSSVAAVTNLALAATASINNDGITIPAIKSTWTVSPNSFVSYYEIQYKRLGGEEDYGGIASSPTSSTDYGLITATATSTEDYGLTNEPVLSPDANFASLFGSSNSFTIEPVLNGYDYQVKVRAISALGVRSPFVTASLASAGDTTSPNEPLGLTAVGGSKFISVGWVNPADQDLDFVEIYENSSNNLNTATLAGTSSSTNFMRPNLANNSTRYFWVRAVDYSLNKSDFVGSVNATTLLISPNDFDQAVNNLFTEAGAFGIEPVSALPTTNLFDGKLVLLLSSVTIYRYDASSSAWSTNLFTASSTSAGSVTISSFASGIEPVGVVSSLPTISGYAGPKVIVLTTDGKLYRLVDGAWTAAVNTADISGTIGENLFSDTLRPIERVASLPTTSLTQGRVVLLEGDNKLYRYTGNDWTTATAATDLTGQVTGTQISDNAITASKIGAAAITTAKLANDAVTADIIAAAAITTAKLANDAVTADIIAASAITSVKISDDAITSVKIAADAVTAAKVAVSAITTDKISTDAITTAKIANDAVTSDLIAASAITETKISDNAITTNKISTDSITSSKIAASSIIADKIATNAITTAKISAGAITSDEIAADAVTAGSIEAGAITTAKIAAGAITADEIAADAVTAVKIVAGAITTAKIEAGAITADEIAANAITTAKIAAGAITAGEIAADAVTADSIIANAITTAKIAAGAITAGEIAADAVTADSIISNAITTAKIAAGAITADEIAADAVTADSIISNAVTTAKIAAGAVSADEIAANAITTAKIAANAITAGEIAANAITTAKIDADAITSATIAAGAITADEIATDAIISDKIAAGAITAGEIATDAITAAKISAGAIISDKIAAASILTSKIAAGAVTAAKISVDELSAVSATIGTFESAASGARMVLKDDQITIFDSDGNVRVKIGNLA